MWLYGSTLGLDIEEVAVYWADQSIAKAYRAKVDSWWIDGLFISAVLRGNWWLVIRWQCLIPLHWHVVVLLLLPFGFPTNQVCDNVRICRSCLGHPVAYLTIRLIQGADTCSIQIDRSGVTASTFATALASVHLAFCQCPLSSVDLCLLVPIRRLYRISRMDFR